MKTTSLSAFIILLVAFGEVVRSQTVTNRAEPLLEVTLSISLTTNVVTIGSVNNLVAEIKNSSSDWISVSDTWATTLLLTDDSGQTYELPPLVRSDWDNMVSHRSADGIQPGSIYKWPLTLRVQKQIVDKVASPGVYTLKAIHHIMTSDHKNRQLLSNSVRIRLQESESGLSP